jgi:hypothetical protein
MLTMTRPVAVMSVATLLCVAASACEGVLGDVEVHPAPSGRAPTEAPAGGAGTVAGGGPREPSPSARPPLDVSVAAPGSVQGASGSGGASSAPDAGAEEPQPDAASSPEPPPPPPPPPRPVLVVDPASELERIGTEGGGPRLAVCQGGVFIGVRPTANPSEEVFGQRIAFLEPICGTATVVPAASADPAAARIVLLRDDAVVSWSVSDPFLGVPDLTVPDDRLVWITQPETLCPDAAPVLVGLSGEYDPVAPDATDTAALRSLVIECAPIVAASDGIDIIAAASGHQFISQADSFAVSGTDTYGSSCQGGSVMTQLLVHAGFWLDGFVVGCSSLRSPHLAGEACAAESECQSGICAEARCNPE